MYEYVPLSEHTTFKLGGQARYFFRVKNVGEAREALSFARENMLPFFVLGGGSNLLVSDKGFSGVVIKNEILGLSFKEEGEDVLVTAGAGENWDNFVSECVNRDLYGLENLSGIPGTVGAAPVQNIGAYGVEAKDSVVSVEALDANTSAVRNFSAAECTFAYRDSFFKTTKGKSHIITSVTFRLKKNGDLNVGYKDLKNYFAKSNTLPTLRTVRQVVLEVRRGKFPDLSATGTAGSFFKNPIIPKAQFDELKKQFPDIPGFPVSYSPFSKGSTQSGRDLNPPSRRLATSFKKGGISQSPMVKLPLAWILDNILHLKGFMNGPVGLHDAQPLVIVHQGGGTAEDVSRLAEDVARKVKAATGIELEWEVEKL